MQDFGKQEGDICFVAEVDKKIVGAVWVRNMDDYGHVEDGVPSFAISLYKEGIRKLPWQYRKQTMQ